MKTMLTIIVLSLTLLAGGDDGVGGLEKPTTTPTPVLLQLEQWWPSGGWQVFCIDIAGWGDDEVRALIQGFEEATVAMGGLPFVTPPINAEDGSSWCIPDYCTGGGHYSSVQPMWMLAEDLP